jgi:hypothetical protein
LVEESRFYDCARMHKRASVFFCACFGRRSRAFNNACKRVY